MADQIGDGADPQAVTMGKGLELGPPRHAAILVHQLADDARGLEARQAAKVDGGLGVAGPHEHSAPAGTEREDMAGPGEILRFRALVRERADGRRPIAR